MGFGVGVNSKTPQKVVFLSKKWGFIQEKPKNCTFHITWGSIQEWGSIRADTVCKEGKTGELEKCGQDLKNIFFQIST